MSASATSDTKTVDAPAHTSRSVFFPMRAAWDSRTRRASFAHASACAPTPRKRRDRIAPRRRMARSRGLARREEWCLLCVSGGASARAAAARVPRLQRIGFLLRVETRAQLRLAFRWQGLEPLERVAHRVGQGPATQAGL